MGLLDDILAAGQNGGSSPYGALYQSPLTDDDAKRKAAAADMLASMGVSPTNLPQGSPFGDPSQFSVAAPLQGANQPSPLDTAQWPAGPVGAPSPGVTNPTASADPAAPAPAASAPFGLAGAGAPAPSFTDRFWPAVQNPLRQVAAPLPAPVANAQASASPQNAPIAVGNYQMPRIGSGFPSAADEADDETPAAAAPTAGSGAVPGVAAPAGPAPFSLGGAGSSIGDRLMKGTKGFLGNLQNGPVGAVAGGLGALITGKSTDPGSIAAEQSNMTARALLAKNVAPDIVAAAVHNPDLMKTLIAQNFGPDKFQHVTRKDALGGETIGAFDPSTGKTTFDGGGAGAAGAPGFGALMAQGMTYDPNKTGDAYMAQFGPEVQAAAKAYIHGDVMPTGNARLASIASFAKTVAQKWGQDTGVPVNDSTYSGKRKMQTDLASSSNGSMGGILSNGESSFSHLAEATGSMADLGNASHDYPLGGMIAHAQNYLGNKAGGSNTQAKILATVDNLGKYGAESTKFYAGTGGGVEERTAARKDVDPNSVSGEEMAAFAEKEKGLMLDRLNTKFQQIRDTYGEEEGNAIIAKHMPQIQKNIATINANVARMRGDAAPSAAAPGGSAVLPPGNYAWSPQTGVVGSK